MKSGAVNMAPLSAAEMADMKAYLDLGRRLGLLLAQQNKGAPLRAAHLLYRGEAATKNTRLITSSFAAGLLETALAEHVNIVNAEFLAKERGIRITESSSSEVGDFSTMIRATLETDAGDLTAAGTSFGKEFLPLGRIGPLWRGATSVRM